MSTPWSMMVMNSDRYIWERQSHAARSTGQHPVWLMPWDVEPQSGWCRWMQSPGLFWNPVMLYNNCQVLADPIHSSDGYFWEQTVQNIPWSQGHNLKICLALRTINVMFLLLGNWDWEYILKMDWVQLALQLSRRKHVIVLRHSFWDENIKK